MDSRLLDRDVLLDLSVNVIPLVIILFFVGLFLVITPFGIDADATAIQMALLIAPFGALAVLTYYAGKAIVRDEEHLDGEAGEYANVVGEVEGEAAGEGGEDGEAEGESALEGEPETPADDDAGAA